MTTAPTAPNVPLPIGALTRDEWQPVRCGRFYRCIEGETRDIATDSPYSPRIVGVFTYGTQYDDGALGEGVDSPGIALETANEEDQRGRTDTGIALSSQAARRLADALVMAADELDGWVTR